MRSDNFTPKKIHFILLGASNLARARFGLNRYLEKSFPNLILTSITSGPGRAYSITGGILGVNYLPLKNDPIFKLGFENRLKHDLNIAIICDIGNDILYGVPVQNLTQDLEKIIYNLSVFCSHIFTIPIPFKKLKTLNYHQINILKKILFPKCTLSPEKIITSIKVVNTFLHEINIPKFTLLKTMDNYIGWDLAHYGIFKMHAAWTHIIDQIAQELFLSTNKTIDQKLMFRSFVSYWKTFFFKDIIPSVLKYGNRFDQTGL